MPLAFQSTSHGTVAFGFFNIESDMLLLDRWFFFSTEFSKGISSLASAPGGGPFMDEWPGYRMARAEDVGDLTGAIHGIRFTGFIGEVYRLFPFPQDPRGFHQNPEGTGTAKKVEGLAARYGSPAKIPFEAGGSGDRAQVGSYAFSRKVFQDMILYVWRGGYPRWVDESPPDYIREMKERVEESSHPLFDGIVFSAG